MCVLDYLSSENSYCTYDIGRVLLKLKRKLLESSIF